MKINKESLYSHGSNGTLNLTPTPYLQRFFKRAQAAVVTVAVVQEEAI